MNISSGNNSHDKDPSSPEDNIDLFPFRVGIDEIDLKILALLNERANLAIEIGKAKSGKNLKFHSPKREQEIFERLEAENKGPFPNKALRIIFREILSASLSLEKPLKVSFLGPQATFSHLACVEHFGRSSLLIPEKNFRAVFEAVERERVDYGVIPIENSTEGAVANTLDLFMEHDVKIGAEIMMEIRLDLLSRAESLDDINRVYSHPHAWPQCRKWLESHLENVEIIDVASTARAAEIAAGEHHSAAIAGSFAGKFYDLNVLEQRIQDIPNNFTRFFIIGKNDADRTGKDKTSLMFTLKDDTGALYNALKPFSEYNLNLTKIESRPYKGKTWEYIFFVDIEGHHKDENLEAALNKLHEICTNLKLLGSYPSGSKKMP